MPLTCGPCGRFVVLGAGGVGKTSLVLQFMEGFFSSTYQPTVEDCYTHTVKTSDGLYRSFEILDTAGAHNFPAMRELSIRSALGFLLVFSLDSLQSYHEAKQLWALIAKIRGPDVPTILVGNKCDLAPTLRQVTTEMAVEVGPRIYVETSAKFNRHVDEVFTELIAGAVTQFENEKGARNRPAHRRLFRLFHHVLKRSSCPTKNALVTGSGPLSLNSNLHLPTQSTPDIVLASNKTSMSASSCSIS